MTWEPVLVTKPLTPIPEMKAGGTPLLRGVAFYGHATPDFKPPQPGWPPTRFKEQGRCDRLVSLPQRPSPSPQSGGAVEFASVGQS